jgi:hypothetical protein
MIGLPQKPYYAGPPRIIRSSSTIGFTQKTTCEMFDTHVHSIIDDLRLTQYIVTLLMRRGYPPVIYPQVFTTLPRNQPLDPFLFCQRVVKMNRLGLEVSDELLKAMINSFTHLL